MLAQFGNIIFKDMMNLVSNMALEKFCKSFGVKDWCKLAYPYERFYGIEELTNYTSFPPYTDFYSKLYIPVDDNVKEVNELLRSGEISDENLIQALKISAADYNALKGENEMFPINSATMQFFNLSVKKYLTSSEMFVEENCRNMKDWLVIYNEVDTDILAEGIINYAELLDSLFEEFLCLGNAFHRTQNCDLLLLAFVSTRNSNSAAGCVTRI